MTFIKTVAKITTVVTNVSGIVYICREFDDHSVEWSSEFGRNNVNPFMFDDLNRYTIIGSVLVADLPKD